MPCVPGANFPQERELWAQGLGVTHSSVHVPNRVKDQRRCHLEMGSRRGTHRAGLLQAAALLVLPLPLLSLSFATMFPAVAPQGLSL